MKPKNKQINFISAISSLWRSRDELSLRNVRKSHLHYTLSIFFCIALADMPSSFMLSDERFFGLNSSTLMSLAYCLSIATVILIRRRDFSWFFHASSILTAFGFLLWIILPAGIPRLLAGIFCWFGLGGCAVSATFAYVFILMNAERMLGILLSTTITALIVLLHEGELAGSILTYILPVFFVAGVIYCISRFRHEDFPEPSPVKEQSKPSEQGAILFCFISYFAVTIFGESMLAVDGGRTFFSVGMLVSVFFVIIIQIAFTRSVWHIWNLFLVLAAIGVLFMSMEPDSLSHLFGSAIFGAATGMGYIGLIYLSGGVAKRSGSMSFLKKTLLLAALVAIIEYGAAGVLINFFPHQLSMIVPVLVILLLLTFILFSPIFFRILFAHDWMSEFHHPDIGSEEDRFEHLGLSPREKQVCALLLEGYTLKRISDSLGIGYSTVNTYCAGLYRKLNVKSRAELFIHFSSKPDSSD